MQVVSQKERVARMMDQAVLSPAATADDVRQAAAMCVQYGVGNLCVRPGDVQLASQLLRATPVTVASVVGFPHGANVSAVKALEAQLAIDAGATELDMVMNVGQFLSGADACVQADIAAVVDVARAAQVAVKVILEVVLLTPAQIVRACELAIAAGAQYVKTSTGFSHGGATPEAVALMLKCCQGRALVKASGGIRTWAEAWNFVALGVARLGVSSAATILDQAPLE